MKDTIKKILREGIEHIDEFNEATELPTTTTASSPKKQEKGEGSYHRIKSLLNNDIINHSGIMRLIWKDEGGSNATKRSLFKKKLDGSTNDEGGVYRFSEEEISLIKGALEKMSSDINSISSRDK
jgi:hypothetical protein